MATAKRWEDLAVQLRALWPAGMKQGKWPWRDSAHNIAIRLENMANLYHLSNRSDREILSCARIYLSSFDEDKKYMQTLKYFILKESTIAGRKELSSRLANMLDENPITDDEPITLDENEILG